MTGQYRDGSSFETKAPAADVPAADVPALVSDLVKHHVEVSAEGFEDRQPGLYWAFQFVPFTLMALLLAGIVVLGGQGRARGAMVGRGRPSLKAADARKLYVLLGAESGGPAERIVGYTPGHQER